MHLRSPSPPPILIERPEQIAETCDHIRSVGRFAFDTEFVMEDRFESEVCLIQIATEERVVIVDPFLDDLNLTPIWELVSNPNIETVVHAGQEDLGLCVQHTDQVPRRVFDVQVAAALAGYEYPLSLQKLVQATLHIRLHKSKTLTDWRRRPLSSEQIHYAAEDVEYLPAVYRKLRDRLIRMDRAAWMEEESLRLEDIALYRRADEDKLLRVKGAGGLKPRQLAVVREILHWREQLAQNYNRPARVVLKDHLLVEMAKLGLSTVEAIRDLRGINLKDKDVRALCEVVERAKQLPSDAWPEVTPRDTLTREEEVITHLATAVIKNYCLEHNVDYGIVATQKSVRELICHLRDGKAADRAEVELLNGWRGRTVGHLLEDVLSGRQRLSVQSRSGELTLQLSPQPTERPNS